jgi:hypothetical protein
VIDNFYYLDGSILHYHNYDKILHREDGPAIEYSEGDKCWYQNNKRHREDGPAIEFSTGTKCWYQNDKRHRIDGPAIEFANGEKSWYYKGKQLMCFSQEQFEKLIKLKAFW